ncbi:toxin-antitoxin system TumE family protein [Thermoanaerobacterium thermosaccharolyticum]|jgi:hypothetical protein|uniref:toxin-antitoxin system TumE family protein n=1 Tax=Thermoanaerobacterium thermosaccharolyticum TaxID=1517 RepID=UPI00123AA34E|nr:DUF6516 family protein [Thermoanaerobacterium thermosaccharolyticum]KAA5805758.1 hypothetical protein F1655_12625 [Thermoanaerobacterium thermosaccharolyticum]
MTDLYPSNFQFLKKAYRDIIIEDYDCDQSGRKSDSICQRKTFIFIDGSSLSITEYLKDGKIDYYFYDWYSQNKNLILKIHSERHKDKKCQTDTEPFHIHIPTILDKKRLPNYSLRDLFSVLEFIRLFIYIKIK